MFQRKKPQENQERMSRNKTSRFEVKYPKPEILLMDLSPDVGEHLRQLGFNVVEGSFGRPYEVPRKTSSRQNHRYTLLLNGNLPEHYIEKEIIIIDLAIPDLLPEPTGEALINSDGNPILIEPHNGIIDPRPASMLHVKSEFDRILEFGGIFLIFAHSKSTITGELTGSREELGNRFHAYDEINTWAFLSELATPEMEVHTEEGKETEIDAEVANTEIGQFLQSYISEGNYTCTINVTGWLKRDWLPTATNKYGKAVAGIMKRDEEKSGFIFLFPQIRNKAEFLEHLLLEYLPTFGPQLFPHVEGAKWVQWPKYELRYILQLQGEIVKLQEETANQIAALEQQINEERISNQFMYDLITETGDVLVIAVQTTLKTLGFYDVVDMDAELEKNGNNEPKREDLQIRDTSPLILVEVKGITNTPKDSSALQVSKYLAPRMKALDRTDIHGLSIINHQRNIPALDRIPNPFSEDILESASQGDFGLLTTWNLYKLLRNFHKFQWSHEQVKSLFYQNGFIEPIPNHYEYVGFVEEYWPKINVVGIRIEKAELQLGDTLAFVLPVEYEELCIDSLQVEKESVKTATAGQLAGVLLKIDGSIIKKKTGVYRVK